MPSAPARRKSAESRTRVRHLTPTSKRGNQRRGGCTPLYANAGAEVIEIAEFGLRDRTMKGSRAWSEGRRRVRATEKRLRAPGFGGGWSSRSGRLPSHGPACRGRRPRKAGATASRWPFHARVIPCLQLFTMSRADVPVARGRRDEPRPRRAIEERTPASCQTPRCETMPRVCGVERVVGLVGGGKDSALAVEVSTWRGSPPWGPRADAVEDQPRKRPRASPHPRRGPRTQPNWVERDRDIHPASGPLPMVRQLGDHLLVGTVDVRPCGLGSRTTPFSRRACAARLADVLAPRKSHQRHVHTPGTRSMPRSTSLPSAGAPASRGETNDVTRSCAARCATAG